MSYLEIKNVNGLKNQVKNILVYKNENKEVKLSFICVM
jgi:hypothetical protein